VTKDELVAHCLSKPGAWQDEPWEGDTVVKVGPKIFAFLGSGDGAATHGSVGVKCSANRDAADECPTSADPGGTPCVSAAQSPTTRCSTQSTSPTE
jgi:predicted DNA-binding protein (MmcQ/YjbR family)